MKPKQNTQRTKMFLDFRRMCTYSSCAYFLDKIAICVPGEPWAVGRGPRPVSQQTRTEPYFVCDNRNCLPKQDILRGSKTTSLLLRYLTRRFFFHFDTKSNGIQQTCDFFSFHVRLGGWKIFFYFNATFLSSLFNLLL